MRLKCKSSDFIKAINQASKIAFKNNTNPIFECIFLKVDNHKLIVKSTNLEVLYEKSIDILGEINGECYVSGEIINKIVSNFEKNDSLEIEKTNSTLGIKSSKEEVFIDIFDINERFPSAPVKTEDSITINIKKLTDSIKNVTFASSKSDIKPEIASVYIYNKEDFVYFVATDSYRLAEKRINNSFNLLKDFNFIIPIKNIINIIQILDEEDGDRDITISVYGDGIVFENNYVFISSRVVSGNYPDYRQLFPSSYKSVFETDKQELVKALNLNNLITTQYNFTKAIFYIKNTDNSEIEITAEEKSRGRVKKKIAISIKNIERNNEEEEGVDVDNVKNIFDEVGINYNTGYFLEGLSKTDSGKVLLSYTDPNRALFVSNNNDLSFVYLLMPINR